MTFGHSRGSRSSTLVSSTSAVPGSGPTAAAGSPTKSRSTLAWLAGSRPPAPIPDVAHGHRRLRGVRRGVAGQQCGAGGRAQLCVARTGQRRDAAQQLGDGGGRHRHRAVCADDAARADRDGRHDELVEAEVGEAGAHPDDVGDRVESADLVEVDLGRRGPVHRRLGLREPLERGVGGAPHVVGQRRPRQQVRDVAPGAVGGAVGDLHVATGGREPVTRDLLGRQRNLLRGHRGDGRRDHLDRHARRRRAHRAACPRWLRTRRRPSRSRSILARAGVAGDARREDAGPEAVVDVDDGHAGRA